MGHLLLLLLCTLLTKRVCVSCFSYAKGALLFDQKYVLRGRSQIFEVSPD